MFWHRIRQLYQTQPWVLARRALVTAHIVSVLFLAIGVWPLWVGWVLLASGLLFLVAAPRFEAALFFVAVLPVSIVLPVASLNTIPSWRVWVLVLLLRVLWGERSTWRLWLRRAWQQQAAWDLPLVLLTAWATVSLLWARFPGRGLKQVVFFANAMLLYVVVRVLVRTRDDVRRLLGTTVWSLGFIVALGYVQFIATLFADQYYFWQYWAQLVTRTFYGARLADTVTYSNSWFSFTGGQRVLRMFSIMPDSHSFAMVCALFIAAALAYLWYFKPAAGFPNWKALVCSRVYGWWYAVRFAGLAIILSGTRGVWVGMLPSLVVSVLLLKWQRLRSVIKPMVIAQLFIILFFALSPFINWGLNAIRFTPFEEHFLERAQSIYDLQESSNVGRLIIWRDSLRYALKHPAGAGYGNFIISLVDNVPDNATYDSLAAQKNTRYNLPQRFVSAHSLYLSLLVELSVVGVGLFVWLWYQFFVATARFVWRVSTAPATAETVLVASFSLLMVWFLAYSVFDVTWLNDRVLLYTAVLAALVAVVVRPSSTAVRPVV
jgi:hypothetical protein